MSLLINMSDTDLLSLFNRVHDKLESPERALRELKSRSGQASDATREALKNEIGVASQECFVDSASDERVVNNLMRHNYRVLSDSEKSVMQNVKDLGLEFVDLLHKIGGTDVKQWNENARQSSRELSIAQTKIEEAVMWTVKHVTR